MQLYGRRMLHALVGVLLGVALESVTGSGVARSIAYGPDACVSIERSSAGSCVLRTNCAGQDISNYEFSFDCVNGTEGRTSHSLGVGSFDESEEFDTEQKCDQCLPPAGEAKVASAALQTKVQKKTPRARPPRISALQLSSADHKKTEHHHFTSKKVAKKDHPMRKIQEKLYPEGKVEKYGPDSCVSVWKSDKTEHCIMQTDCSPATDLSVYDFGMMCMGEDAQLTRHLFGENSFGPKETYDTGVKCQECLSLDEYMNSAVAVQTLATEVHDLSYGMKQVSNDIKVLNMVVFNQTAQGAPPPEKPLENAIAPTFGDGKEEVILRVDSAQSKPIEVKAKPHVGLLTRKVRQQFGHKRVATTREVDRRHGAHGLRGSARHEAEDEDEDDEATDEDEQDYSVRHWSHQRRRDEDDEDEENEEERGEDEVENSDDDRQQARDSRNADDDASQEDTSSDGEDRDDSHDTEDED